MKKLTVWVEASKNHSTKAKKKVLKKKSKPTFKKREHEPDYYGVLPDPLVLDMMNKIYHKFWDLNFRMGNKISSQKFIYEQIGGSSVAFSLAFNILLKAKIINKRNGEYNVSTNNR